MRLDDILDSLANSRERVTTFYTGEKGRSRFDVQAEEVDKTESKLFGDAQQIGV